MQAPRFDTTEPLLHRVLTLRSASDILFPSSVSSASEKADIRARLAIYAYNVKEPHIQVERAYTPLYALARPDPRDLQLLVKRYRDGEVSRYLHRVRPGTDVSLRGPEVTWQLRDDTPIPEEIVMLVAGTGVTTAHQLLSNVFDSGAITPTTPRITVLYAAPTMDSLQLIPELNRYQKKFASHVSVRAYVESMPLLRHASVTSAQGEAVPAALAPRMSFTEHLTSLLLGRRKQWDLVMVPSTLSVVQGRIESEDLASYLPQPHHRRLVLGGT
ncbi:cytochrome-b5 reductase [Malassezia nana]|uniref:Cytochrome-b5 reductase n=1 Tax=Malassezia nana TaxID=180528 RepID=A0AAF0J7A7_9BASI|nr:cytochrome-b5 reductase [Malassezia nana]